MNKHYGLLLWVALILFIGAGVAHYFDKDFEYMIFILVFWIPFWLYHMIKAEIENKVRTSLTKNTKNISDLK